MNSKATPKSCSCAACKRGKHRGAKSAVKTDEKKFRHNAKIALNKGAEVIGIAPKGNYYD